MLHYEIIKAQTEDSALSTLSKRKQCFRSHEISQTDSCNLVCLHGFLESSSMWNVLDLNNYARLILIDLPGHGKSNLEGIDSMQSMAEMVKAVIDKEDIGSYDVLGHSMGGYVALELKEMDARCNQLLLMNSNVWSDGPQKVLDRQRVADLVQTKKKHFISEAIPNLFQSPENHPSEVKALIAEAVLMESEAIARASIAMSQRRDFSEAVSSGEKQITVIQGENDPIAPKDRMEPIMANQIENFHVVPSGHMAHLEARDAVIDILKKKLG